MTDTVQQLLRQVLDGQSQLSTRIEQVNNGVGTISTRLEEQETKIKSLTDAIVGTADKPGLITKMALAQDHIKRLEDRLEKREADVDGKLKALSDTDGETKEAMTNMSWKVKLTTALLGAGGGGVGMGAVKLLELISGG